MIVRKRIYIAGPMYRKNKRECHPPKRCWSNIREAIRIGMELYKKGWKPYIPHLNALIDIVMETNLKGIDWIESFDFPWLECCEALYYIGHSLGADQELEYAKKRGMKIYKRLEDVPNV